MTQEMREKISLFCNVEPEAVIEEKDVDHTIYEVPIVLKDQGLDRLIEKKLGLSHKENGLEDWQEIVEFIKHPHDEVTVAVVGKYIHLHDAYKSIYESLAHAGITNRTDVKILKIDSEAITAGTADKALAKADAILVPGGFGERGISGKIESVRIARQRGIPYFGICLGLHMAVIEFARNVLGLKKANSTEVDPATPDPVICLLDEQKDITDKGGTMRLGAYPCRLEPGRALDAYGAAEISERHRHRYEFNNSYRDILKDAGLVPTGIYEKDDLVEILEIADHPWFVAVQFHPEFKSKPTSVHPLFRDFVKATLINRTKGKPAGARV